MSLYVDANADAPVLPAAFAAYRQGLSEFADAALLPRERKKIARCLDVDAEELYFLSGGTEADAFALIAFAAAQSSKGMRPLFLLSAIEHPAVAKTAALLAAQNKIDLKILAVSRRGLVDLEGLDSVLTGEMMGQPTRSCLVSVLAASNETGVLQPIAEIAALCRRHGAFLHSDAVQLCGRLPLSLRALGADLVTLSAHKFGGMPGLGVLYARRPLTLATEDWVNEVSGASNIPGVAALAAALSQNKQSQEWHNLEVLRDHLESGLRAQIEDIEVVGEGAPRLANTSCIRFGACEADGLLMALDLEGIAVSTGSACSSGAIEPSAVLLAMGFTKKEARQVLRFSLIPTFTAEEIERVVARTAFAVRRLRSR